MYRFNFSGHPVPDFEIAPFIGANFPRDAGQLRQEMRKALLAIPHRDEVLAGAAVEVVLPGLSQAAAVLLAEWHGQFGNWPLIRWAVRGEQGYEYPPGARVDLNDVRDSARTARGVDLVDQDAGERTFVMISRWALARGSSENRTLTRTG